MQIKTLRHIRFTDWLLLGVLCVGLIALKINHLSLPCFWDEAWSYFPALQAMTDQGPSMMPASIDPELYRGHPLLFYFLASAWMKMVGGVGWWAVRLFPLLLSLLLLSSIYFFGKRFFGQRTAAVGTVLFAVQSVFLAQSSFLLPEVLVALMTVLAVYAYFAEHKWATCLWLSLLLLTKESGIVLWGTVGLFELYKAWQGKYLFNPKTLLRNTWSIAISVLPVLAFFILQKMRLGWFFFPEHIGYVVFNPGEVLHKMLGIFSYLFIDMGRNLLTVFGGVVLIFLFIGKTRIDSKVLPLLCFIGLFTLLYAVFSAMNFYTPRYLLSVLPLVIISFVYLLDRGSDAIRFPRFEKYRNLFYALLLMALLINNLSFTFGKIKGNDHNLGFAQAIKTHQAAVAFLEANAAPDQRIAAGFLSQTNLTNPDLGYLKLGHPFTNLTSEVDDSTAFAIVTSTEQDEAYLSQLSALGGKLLMRFGDEGIWAAVYKFE